MHYIIIIICLTIALSLFAQNVLFYDEDFSDDIGDLLDTLTSNGVTVHYVSDEGWTNLMDMDMLWIQSASAHDSLFISMMSSIVNFARMVAKL